MTPARCQPGATFGGVAEHPVDVVPLRARQRVENVRRRRFVHDRHTPGLLIDIRCAQPLEEQARTASGSSRRIEQLVAGGAVFVREHHRSHRCYPQSIKRLSAPRHGFAPAEPQQNVPSRAGDAQRREERGQRRALSRVVIVEEDADVPPLKRVAQRRQPHDRRARNRNEARQPDDASGHQLCCAKAGAAAAGDLEAGRAAHAGTVERLTQGIENDTRLQDNPQRRTTQPRPAAGGTIGLD